MPIVAPKVKVVRVSGVPSSNIRVIDLGMIDLSSAVPAKKLISYLDGQFIKSVIFFPDNFVPMDSTNDIVCFVTPSNGVTNGGFALVQGLNSGPGGIGLAYDTLGIIPKSLTVNVGGSGLDSSTGKVGVALDPGPLFAGNGATPNAFRPLVIWIPNTAYAVTNSCLIDSNGHFQSCLIGGISGLLEPSWDNSGGTTNDGTVVWQDNGAIPTVGTVHAVAEVINLPGVVIPKPTTIEFVQQPTNVIAGGTITPPITVRVLNQFGQPYTIEQNRVVNIAILGAGTLNGTFNPAIDASTGIATFSDLSITEAANGYILQAVLIDGIEIPAINSNPFNVT